MIPLYKPYMPELPELLTIISSGALAYGKYTKEFEEKLKAYFKTPYVIATNSFNTAISVAITTLGLTWGDEIIASPMACLASTQPYASSGLKVRWCDVDDNRGTLDPDALKRTISTRTKAIVHNHFCGYPGYIDEINLMGREFGIPIIDDGIECFGSEYKGKKIGNCGTEVTVFSFTAVRIPNTIDGGAVIFKDRELYEKSLRIRDSGIDRTKFRDDLGEISLNCDISEIGYSATMSNVNGYIGSIQMDIADKLISKQRANASIINTWLASNADHNPIKCKNIWPNYWVYGMLCNDKRSAIESIRKMGLYASGVHINNNLYSVFGDQCTLSGVQKFYSRFVAIPAGWWMEEEQCRSALQL